MVIGNIKQQNLNLQSTIKAKEEQFIQLERQLDDCQKRLNKSSEDTFRLNEEIKLSSKEMLSLQNQKEDLEQKVIFIIYEIS